MTGTAEPGTGTTTETTTEDPEAKPTETVEFWKAKAREQERRAKANADAADKLAKLEDDQKTEAQKNADARAAAEKDAVDARADALRWRIAAKHGITDEDAEMFLTGIDEATLTKQAERLTERVATSRKQGNVVPKEGSTTPPQPNDVAAFTRQLFSSTSE